MGCFFVGRACSLGGYLCRYHLMGRRTFFPWLCFFQHGVPLKTHPDPFNISSFPHGLLRTSKHKTYMFGFCLFLKKKRSVLMSWVLLLITVELFTVGVDGVDGTHPTLVLFFLNTDWILFCFWCDVLIPDSTTKFIQNSLA